MIEFEADGVLIDYDRVVEAGWRQLSAEFELDADLAGQDRCTI
jgi:beta-phosphoglucomutase-like phosphatase (HAD superfamily)